ncbi:MAG: DUF4349 domain-containing protein, partial [Lachnospiraceae bacterium]|nr:DUF4349 domain-containing protein [Lachnospiraceae bacterium]
DYSDDSESEPIQVDENTSKNKTSKKLNRDKIVYSGNLTIETMDYKQSKKDIKKLIEDHDGIIQSENEYYNDNDWYYDTSDQVRTLNITARIPSAKFHEVMEGADEIGHVTVKSQDASNVTREYYDVQARLKTKKAELERFQEILSKAEKIQDILDIESRISDVQYEIDSARSQLDNLDLDVAYSTLTISMVEVLQYSRDAEKATSKLQETLIGAGHFFMSFLWTLFRIILYVGPCAIVIIAILYGLYRLKKKFIKPRKKQPRRPFGWRRQMMPPYGWPMPYDPSQMPGMMPPQVGSEPDASREGTDAPGESEAAASSEDSNS